VTTENTPRTVAVVGDATITALLSFALAPFGCTVLRTDTIGSLIDARREGSVPRDLDGVIVTDLTGASHKELLQGVGSLLLARVPVALIAYDQSTVTFMESAYPTLEAGILKTHGEWIARQEANGRTLTAVDRENPLHSTYLTLAPASGGAELLLNKFGPTLRTPIAAEALTGLGPQYAMPFPHPTGSGFAATTGSTGRSGRILTVISDKGGCGKSSVALMLASSLAYHTYLAGQPKSVVVVDLDRQSQLAAQFPSATGSITSLRSNSLPDEVMAACHDVPEVGNLWLLLGSRRSGDHLALRTVELYSHIITTLANLFDVVIVDGSVGTTSDPVTSWAQQHSDGVYYVLDPSTESLTLAVDARENSLLPVDKGGLGLDTEKFRIIENRVIEAQPAAHKAEWNRAVAQRLSGTTIEARLPDSHPEVTLAKAYEGGLVELVQTSDVLREPLRDLAMRIYPDIVKDDDSSGKRKKFWERG
jgi:MinD-like ATPase involved in chromosome partitioning or flagellar assembly